MKSLDQLRDDLRYAIRAAISRPGFALVVVLNFAIGIGINTAVFTVVNAVLLRQPGYADPSRLVAVHERFPALGELTTGVSPAEYLDYRDRIRAFAAVAGYEDAVFDLTGGFEPLRIRAERSTHTLFDTLGVRPLLGRTFSEAEDRFGSANVVVLSYELWQHLFGGSASAIGAAIRLNEQAYTVIGVMPAGFEFPFTIASVSEPPAAWVPMAFAPRELADRIPELPVHIVGRLKPDVSIDQARQDVERVVAEFQREHPDVYRGNARVQAGVEPLGSADHARTQPVLLALSGAVLFVLLIACANITNMLLARAATRQKEIAMRMALGASSGRLVQQLLTESLLLSATGALLGCGLAALIIAAVPSVWPWFSGGTTQLRMDLSVLAFTVGLSVAAAVFCGLAPALSSARAPIASSLQSAGRLGGSSLRQRLRSGLVILEASSAVVLLIGSGLLIHSFVEVLRVPAGFSPDGLVIARTTFNRQRYPSDDRRREALRQMTSRLAALPGVTAVAVSTHIPLADDRQIGFLLEGEAGDSVRWADNALVDGSYFSAMGIRLLRGRTFGDQDGPRAPLSAIVNASMARRFWPDGDALGKRLLWGGRPLTIVGVVGDVHIGALDAAVATPTIYCSVYQVESAATTRAVFVVRAADGREVPGLAPAVRRAIWSVDAGVPVFDIRAMTEIVAQSLGVRRFALMLLTAFGVVALALAVVGLYSVLSYAVAQRTSELGVRLAIGAKPAQILRLVLADGLRLTAIGLVVGALLGAVLARTLSRLLYGIAPLDPIAFGAACFLMLIVSLLASGGPARRAARVDPLVALRAE
jgi:putative ABC transport system permease protein